MTTLEGSVSEFTFLSNGVSFNDFQWLQWNVYKARGNDLPKYGDQSESDWVILKVNGTEYFLGDAGFAAATYLNKVTGEVVISYRGTGDFSDFATDTVFASNNLTTQITEAENYYTQVVQHIEDYKNDIKDEFGLTNTAFANFIDLQNSLNFTGHSLGGGLAQYMGAITGHSTVIFNALGMDTLVRQKLTQLYGSEILAQPHFHPEKIHLPLAA